MANAIKKKSNVSSDDGGVEIDDIFISYSHKDAESVKRLCQKLKDTTDLNYWIDSDQLRVGDNLPDFIRQAIKNAKVFIVLLTINSVKSQWVEQETDLALKLFKKTGMPLIIPINTLQDIKTLNKEKPWFAELDNILRIDIFDMDQFDGKIDDMVLLINESRDYLYEGRIKDIYNTILKDTKVFSRTPNVSIIRQPDNKGNFLINAHRTSLKTINSVLEVVPPKTHCKTTTEVRLSNKKEIPTIKIKPCIYRTPFFKTNKGIASYVEGYETGLTGGRAVWFNCSDTFIYLNDLALLRSSDGGKTAEVIFDLYEPDFSLADDEEEENSQQEKPIIKSIHYPVISKDDRYIAISINQKFPGKSREEGHLRIWDQVDNNGLIETEGTGSVLASSNISQAKLWAPHTNSLVFGVNFGNPISVLPIVLAISKNRDIDRYALEKPIDTAITQFAWSPDGGEIAVVRGGGGIYEIAIYDKQFKNKRIYKSIVGSYVRWLNDGEILMISGGGIYELATFSVKDLSKKRVITKTDKYREFEISTNRKLIAYWERDSSNEKFSSLWVQHIDSGYRSRVAEVHFDETHSLGGVGATILSWSFDSKKLLVSANNSIVILHIPF